MIKTTAIALFVGLLGHGVLAANAPTTAPAAIGKVFEGEPAAATQSPIDQAVFGQLRRLGIQPARVCSDAVFVRRVYLDTIGTLPTAQEAREFLLDRRADKRQALIERLLQREEFADYWAMKWGDLLRVKSEFPINLWPNATQAYHHWIRASLRENKPYDRFVRELLTASGSDFRVPPANFYRALQSKEPQAIAQAVALTFMATRAENWPKERLAGMAAFFAQVGYKSTAEWKEEIVFHDPTKAAGSTTRPVYPDGTPARLAAGADGRLAFADWLLAPNNPYLARAIANRVWSWLLGRGIVHEPDDIRPDNPPSNPQLLALLERELIAARYDLKQLYRLILNSQVYQLSCIGPAGAESQFASYPLRRLEAEVLIDALCQLTETTEKYSSAVPEPFTFIPQTQRTILLADGSITSPFLEMFGRPPRDTGLEGERNNRPTADQRLHLLNSSHIQRKLEQMPLLQSRKARTASPEAIDELYLTILSRFPSEAERQAVAEYARSGNANGRELLVDVAWALINSAEFLYRH